MVKSDMQVMHRLGVARLIGLRISSRPGRSFPRGPCPRLLLEVCKCVGCAKRELTDVSELVSGKLHLWSNNQGKGVPPKNPSALHLTISRGGVAMVVHTRCTVDVILATPAIIIEFRLLMG